MGGRGARCGIRLGRARRGVAGAGASRGGTARCGSERTLLVAPDAYLRVLSPQATSDIGAVLGYRYSSLLGHGLAIGAYAQFGLSRSVDLNLSFGLLVFPDGADRLRRDQNLPSSTQFSFPGPNVSLALGASFAFFP